MEDMCNNRDDPACNGPLLVSSGQQWGWVWALAMCCAAYQLRFQSALRLTVESATNDTFNNGLFDLW